MKMKFNEEAPEQHMAILAIGGVMIFISVITSLGGKQEQGPDQPRSYAESGVTKYQNPKLSWIERNFCRGYRRSFFCGFKVLHPLRESLEEQGIAIGGDGIAPQRGGYNCKSSGACNSMDPYNTGPNSDSGIVRYHGPLPSGRGLSQKIVVDNFL